MDALAARLLPRGAVMTPNLPEAELLAGMSIAGEGEMEEAARIISGKYGGAVLVKGGHQGGTANDVLCRKGQITWFRGDRVDSENTHGTGCTLSSAIAANLAKGYGLTEAVERAKSYLSDALRAMLDLGKGSGPMDHGFAVGDRYGEALL